MTRNEFLKEISQQHPEIIGTCLYNGSGDIVCRGLSALITEEQLRQLGSHLLRMLNIGRHSDLEVASGYFQFDKYTIIGMPIERSESDVLFILCEPFINYSLVATTVALLAVDLEKNIEQRQGKRSLFKKKKKPTKNDPWEAVQDNSSIKPYMDKIEQALATAIGPVANFIMQDYTEQWSENGPAHPDRLPELVDMLADEIGNADLARDFRARVKNIL